MIGNEQNSKVSNYRPELDGLRAIAVIFVIINHFSTKALPSGFLGVDIFFVLSGYVVSASLYKRLSPNWYTFLFQFYARRIRRIFPALIFCVVVTGYIGCLFIQHPQTSLKAGMYSLLGASNIHFYSHSSDYFGEVARHNLFTNTWSLGVEEQFYVIFPIVLILVGFSAHKRLLSTLVGLALTSFLAWVWMSMNNPPFSFFMIFTRFWELGLGCITFLLVLQFKTYAFTSRQKIGAAIALGLILVIAILPKQVMLYSTPLMCFSVAALIFFMRAESATVRLLSRPEMVRIGILSYSLYLWHWPVISLSVQTVGISAYTIIFQILVMLLLAQFSFVFIERPFRYGKLLRKDLVSIVSGFSAIAVSVGLLSVLGKSNNLFFINRPKFDLTRPVFSIQPSF